MDRRKKTVICHHLTGSFKLGARFPFLPTNPFCFHIILFVFIIITRKSKWPSGEARMVWVGGPGFDPRSQHISFSCFLSTDHVHHPLKRLPYAINIQPWDPWSIRSNASCNKGSWCTLNSAPRGIKHWLDWLASWAWIISQYTPLQ